MQLLTFVFTSNLTPGKTVSVKGTCMKHAMPCAAKRLGVNLCNLVFLRIEPIKNAA